MPARPERRARRNHKVGRAFGPRPPSFPFPITNNQPSPDTQQRQNLLSRKNS